MGRLTNEKCWACSLITATEARKLHDNPNGSDAEGGMLYALRPCSANAQRPSLRWSDDTCHSRRSYYRQSRGRTARRNLAIEELTVPIPDFPYVVLHTYLAHPRELNDEVVIHAICAELWIGSTSKAMTQPQHTFGLPPRSVKEYAKQLT